METVALMPWPSAAHVSRHLTDRKQIVTATVAILVQWVIFALSSRPLWFALLAVITATTVVAVWRAFVIAIAAAARCDERSAGRGADSELTRELDAWHRQFEAREAMLREFTDAPTPQNATALHELLLAQRIDREEWLKRNASPGGSPSGRSGAMYVPPRDGP